MKTCERCGEKFKALPRQKGNQRFCGSLEFKTGCSWENRLIYHNNFNKKWRKKNWAKVYKKIKIKRANMKKKIRRQRLVSKKTGEIMMKHIKRSVKLALKTKK